VQFRPKKAICIVARKNIKKLEKHTEFHSCYSSLAETLHTQTDITIMGRFWCPKLAATCRWRQLRYWAPFSLPGRSPWPCTAYVTMPRGLLCSPHGLLCDHRQHCRALPISGSENGDQYQSSLCPAASFGKQNIYGAYTRFVTLFLGHPKFVCIKHEVRYHICIW
jgi:hypothetical protein